MLLCIYIYVLLDRCGVSCKTNDSATGAATETTKRNEKGKAMNCPHCQSKNLEHLTPITDNKNLFRMIISKKSLKKIDFRKSDSTAFAELLVSIKNICEGNFR